MENILLNTKRWSNNKTIKYIISRSYFYLFFLFVLQGIV